MSGIDFEDLESFAPSNVPDDPATNALLAEIERKSNARKLALPTNDRLVKQRLRDLKEPITKFGEKREDRRERLRTVISLIKQKEGISGDAESDESDDDGEEKQEEFFTEGTQSLADARRWIARYSLPRAKKRVARQKMEAKTPLGRILDARKLVFNELKSYTSMGTQIGDERPISVVRFSPDASMIATASWSGTVKLWDIPGCRKLDEMKGPDADMLTGLAWHPQATLSQTRSSVNLASAGADMKINLWSLDGLDKDPNPEIAAPPTKPLRTLSGHSHRICRIAFHPSGRYIGSASFDQTWRLWDVEQGNELLLQEGHSKEVYGIAFQGDGSLACTGGMDAIGRVWDLRSGRSVMILDGHVKGILGIDFAPNGYQIVTSSNDDTIKVWDIRSLKSIYTIPAHRSTISDIKFFRPASTLHTFPITVPKEMPKIKSEPQESLQPQTNGVEGASTNGESTPTPAIKEEPMDLDIKEEFGRKMMEISTDNNPTSAPLAGMYLASSGYDGFVKIWSADDWQLVKALSSDTGGRVMSVDLSSDGKYLATGEWARTFKLWAAENVEM